MFAKNPIVKYAYIYMAQPLCHYVPPICLACLGTNNKFSAEDLLPRWRYIVEECSRRNISVLSFKADRDSRIMKCMKVFTSLMAPLSAKDASSGETLSPVCIPPNWEAWFYIQPSKIGYVKDTVHLAVKL